MARTPLDFDALTPTGAGSPRQGDDQLRLIKLYTQNLATDMTQPTGVGTVRHDIYGARMIGDLSGDAAGGTSAMIDGRRYVEALTNATTDQTTTPTHWATYINVPSNTVTLTIAAGTQVGQIMNITATQAATLTVSWTSGQGISLGNQVKIASGIWNGTNWYFSETITA